MTLSCQFVVLLQVTYYYFFYILARFKNKLPTNCYVHFIDYILYARCKAMLRIATVHLSVRPVRPCLSIHPMQAHESSTTESHKTSKSVEMFPVNYSVIDSTVLGDVKITDISILRHVDMIGFQTHLLHKPHHPIQEPYIVAFPLQCNLLVSL